MTESLLRLNTIECPCFDWGASFALKSQNDLAGFCVIKHSPDRLYRGPDPDFAHLSAIAFTEPSVGVDLLAAAKEVLRSRGLAGLKLGQDSRHFFPGCPADCAQLRSFLTVEGFVPGADAVDVERDLADYDPAGTEAIPDGFSMRRCTDEDVLAIGEFLAREFPGRWRHDTLAKIEAEGPETIFGLFEGGTCEGFAILQSDGCRLPIGGAVWHQDLGDHWGSLGPIGVSKGVRGKKLGGSLLANGLIALKERGVRRTIIDWTTLVEFYGKHGFEVARTYTPYTLKF